jgi:hexosaminidase
LKDLGTSPGNEFEENHFVDHSGCGKQVKLTLPDNTSQSSGGSTVLTDGIKGTKDSDVGDWQKIPENDLIATLDLNEAMAIRKISVNFLQNIARRVFIPSQVEFAISDDGENFKVLSTLVNDISQRQEGLFIKDFTTTFEKAKGRYVRLKAKNIGLCPSWHINSGEQAWLYCDEIQIY